MIAAHESIKNTNQATKDGFKAGDVSAIVASYTSDAVVLAPTSQGASGPGAIRAFIQGMVDSGVRDVKLETRSIEVYGNLALEIGKYTIESKAPNGQPTTVIGKYFVVWKNEAGAWKIHNDMSNVGAP